VYREDYRYPSIPSKGALMQMIETCAAAQGRGVDFLLGRLSCTNSSIWADPLHDTRGLPAPTERSAA
jgi:hypothetical protein